MANAMIGNPTGFSNVIKPRNGVAVGENALPDFFFNATRSFDAMRGFLSTMDAGYFTEKRLNAMTANDMVYSIRVAVEGGYEPDPGGV